MIVSQSATTVQTAFQDLWLTVVQYVPAIVLAVIVFLIGWIVSIILYRVVIQIVKILRVDEALKAAGVSAAAKDAGFNLDIGRFLGTLVKWFVVIVFLVAALDIVGLSIVTLFLQQVVLLYLPNVIAAVIILILAAVVAEAVKALVIGSAKVAGAHSANLAGTVAKWAIWVVAILAALSQLNVATEFVQTLFTGLVVALALAFGLSFGLGGKEAASRTIDRVRSEIATHRG